MCLTLFLQQTNSFLLILLQIHSDLSKVFVFITKRTAGAIFSTKHDKMSEQNSMCKVFIFDGLMYILLGNRCWSVVT